ncbi:hypothetical protein CVT25_012128 [Psilocybe cyanescens]|uniref:Uncharacterized protein n=1 Tax=Psilocybe cyanescens TaxID=93625 RepID=A0A409XJA0_PSICY|nr:hypothetical protein CVT25_012128 [Psilocybe cyanescens]
MASTHQHHSRYSLPTVPQNSQNDFRLPSLKDLNFQYRSPSGTSQPPSQTELAAQQQDHPRHPAAWGRSAPPTNPSTTSVQSHPHQQQHTPPLSAGHEATPKVEYPSKHENGGYAHPGMPLSAQMASVPPPSVNITSLRNEDVPHSPHQPTQVKRRTLTETIAARDSHYAPQSYQYTGPPVGYPGVPGPPPHNTQPAPPPPPPPVSHEQMQHHSIPPGYTTYQQQQYVHPRPPVMHQQHPTHPQPTHSNPYPSPGPPPPAPPPQGPWSQQPQHPPHQHPSHQQPPPLPLQQQQQQQQPPPPPPPPQQQHHVQHPSHIPPHQQQQQQQQQPPPIPNNPPYGVSPHHLQHAPQPPPPQQQIQQHPPQQQQQPPHHFQQPPQQMPFARTTAIVPTNIDARPTYPTSEPERAPLTRPGDAMSEISNHCSTLYNFAYHWADMQKQHVPPPQPPQAELESMLRLAEELIRLLEEAKRANAPEIDQSRMSAPEAMQESPDDPRPPKRPWEDISQDDAVTNDQNSFPEFHLTPPSLKQQYASGGDSKPQTTAEQDMELIRTKRATTTAGANGPPGQPKSKYRKRSVSRPVFGQICLLDCSRLNSIRVFCSNSGLHLRASVIHVISEKRLNGGEALMERGLFAMLADFDIIKASTDGRRPLLDYAKLMRKRDKNGANGEAPQIDMETLRASARAAEIDKPSRSSKQASSRSHQSEPASPADVKQQTPQQHHQGTFQLMNMMAPAPEQSSSTMSNDSARAPPPQTHAGMPPASLPPPPWQNPPSSITPRLYAAPEHLQHQSFLRGSQHSAPSR